MSVLDGHDLKRASADCYLCGCGKAFFSINGQPSDREIRLQHANHVDEIKHARARIKDAQKNKIQSTLTSDDDSRANWCNPFGQGLFRESRK
jgi:hypothetical protein